MAAMTTAGFLAAVNTSLLMPPKRYSHEPSHRYRVERVEPKYMALSCLPAPPPEPGNIRAGCVVLLNGRYTIYVDARLRGTALSKTLRHEKAHINGWRH